MRDLGFLQRCAQTQAATGCPPGIQPSPFVLHQTCTTVQYTLRQVSKSLAPALQAQAGWEQKVKEEVTELKRTFYCDVCHKQYEKAMEFEQHLSSYDHHHKKRLQEMRKIEVGQIAVTIQFLAYKICCAQKKLCVQTSLNVHTLSGLQTLHLLVAHFQSERTREDRAKRETKAMNKEMAKLQQQIHRARQQSGSSVSTSSTTGAADAAAHSEGGGGSWSSQAGGGAGMPPHPSSQQQAPFLAPPLPDTLPPPLPPDQPPLPSHQPVRQTLPAPLPPGAGRIRFLDG
jgi:hypothetical protein